jgi:hypothetical protein
MLLLAPLPSMLPQPQVSAYLASRAFAEKQAARKTSGTRGIIINAGGPDLLASAIVTLKVWRDGGVLVLTPCGAPPASRTTPA